jgi:hypothetical protein
MEKNNNKFNIDKFIESKHNIKYYNLEDYVKKLGGTITEICKTYSHIDKYGFEDEYIKYIEFYIDEIKICGYFHDMSSYDELERPYAKFTIIE